MTNYTVAVPPKLPYTQRMHRVPQAKTVARVSFPRRHMPFLPASNRNPKNSFQNTRRLKWLFSFRQLTANTSVEIRHDRDHVSSRRSRPSAVVLPQAANFCADQWLVARLRRSI